MIKKIIYIYITFITLIFGQSNLLIYKKDTLNIYSSHTGLDHNELENDYSFWNEYNPCSDINNYIATYKIVDNKLFLTKITNREKESVTASLYLVFKDKYKNGKVFLNNFKWNMYSPIGKKLYISRNTGEYVHEKEIIFSFKNGVLLSIDSVDNYNTKLNYYKDGDISNDIKKYILNKLPQNFLDSISEEIITAGNMYVDKTGKVTSIKFFTDLLINYEIEKILLGTSDWDILYEHGVFVDKPWGFFLKLDKHKIQ